MASSQSRASSTVRAAGAVVLRPLALTDESGRATTITEVALVHRDRYDDWTLPKGKLDPGETAPQAAVREVFEETGLRIRLGVPLDVVRYRLPRGDTKEVEYWVATALCQEPRPPDDEITATEWVTVEVALQRLTHDHDRDLLAQALRLPPTLPLVVLRHAKAVSRSDWDGAESSRPLTRFGQRQARQLKPLLAAYDVTSVISSPWRRCRATVLPYAAGHHLDVQTPEELTEQAAQDHPERLFGRLAELREAVLAAGASAVLCGHRPVLPAILETFGVPGNRKVRTSELCVIHLATDGHAVAAEWHRPAPG